MIDINKSRWSSVSPQVRNHLRKSEIMIRQASINNLNFRERKRQYSEF